MTETLRVEHGHAKKRRSTEVVVAVELPFAFRRQVCLLKLSVSEIQHITGKCVHAALFLTWMFRAEYCQYHTL